MTRSHRAVSSFFYATSKLLFSGDFTLDINPVELEDDARFQCQVGASEGIEPIRSRYATLTVLAPPAPPRLLPEGDVYRTVEGRQVELRCESRGGKPAAEVGALLLASF
jgi:hypothetical protein